MMEIVEIQPFEMPASLFALPPSSVTLRADAVHVWFAVLDHAGVEPGRLHQSLSSDERMRAERFHFRRDRDRFIARHGILRVILSHYVHVEASELRFEQGKNGKPVLAETHGKRPVHFNLSHSNGVALFAFSRDRELGVDIENVREMPEMEHIVEQFFSEKEKAFFHALPEDSKRDAFFNVWTRKEALLKALGGGLSLPLDMFDVAPAPDEGATRLTIDAAPWGPSDWSLRTLRPARGHVGALAMENGSVTIGYFKWMPSGAMRLSA